MWLGVRNPETRVQKRTQNNECPAHNFLLTGWTGRRSRVRLDCERILRPRAQEEKGEEWKRTIRIAARLGTTVSVEALKQLAVYFFSRASSIRASRAHRQILRGSGSIPGRACAAHQSSAESGRAELHG